MKKYTDKGENQMQIMQEKVHSADLAKINQLTQRQLSADEVFSFSH